MTPSYSLRSIILARKGGLILAGLLSTVAGALALAPYLVAYFVAIEVFTKPLGEIDADHILRLALIALIAAVVKGMALLGAEAASHVAAYRILYDIRLALARKMGGLPLGWFNQRSTGVVKKVIHEDTEQLEVGLAHVTPDVIGGVAITIFTTVALFIIDWRMALVTMAVTPLAIAVFSWQLSRLAIMGEYERETAQMNATVIQYINGMKVIKAFTLATQRFAKLRASIQRMRDLYDKMAARLGIAYQLMFVLLRVGAVIVVAPVGLWFYQSGSLDLPTYLFFLLISMTYNRPVLNVIFHGATAVYQIKYAADRVGEIFNAAALTEPANPQRPQNHTIEFKDVSFSYGDPADSAGQASTVLKGVSFTAPVGTMTALVGPSGAGKTTIARLIPRFWDVTGGDIQIGGVSIKEMPIEALMDHVAFVFQDVFLFNDSIYENIRVGKPNATRDEIIAAATAARCHDFIMELGGYDYQVGENGMRLSGGQKQRISVARALLKDAPIIVLDEATAFVDPENESQIQAAIGELTAGAGKTLIVIAHRLSTITGADQILLIDDGRIAAAGTHAELLAQSELYKSMWQAHADAQGWQFSAQQADKRAAAAAVPVHSKAPALFTAIQEPFTNPYAGLDENDDIFRMALKLAGKSLHTRFWMMIGLKVLEGMTIAAPGLILVWILLGLLQPEPNLSQVWWGIGALVLAFVAQLAVGMPAYQASLRLDADIQNNLRLHLSDYLRRLPLGFFTQSDVGTIDSLFTTNLMFLELRSTIGVLMTALIAPVMLFVYMLTQDWRLALALGVSTLPMIFVLRKAMVVFARVWRTQSAARSVANSRMVEYIQGIHIIRAFNLAGGRFERFAGAMEEYRLASTRTVTAMTPWGAVGVFFLEMGFALFLILGQRFYVEGSLTQETFLLFLVLSLAFYLPLYALFEMLAFIRMVQNSVRNINTFLHHPILPEPAQPRLAGGFAIEFNDVSFDYVNRNSSAASTDAAIEPARVLDQVSLTIPERSFTALVGPSGSGKTTITNLIARFWDVQHGAVKIGGVDVREMSSDNLLSMMTMVFQDVYLFNDTVLNNIRIGKPDASDDEVILAAQKAQAHEFIVQMADGYQTVIGESGSTLSGGQKQRISIARAILKDAPIVLLDEATASLDPENEALIQRAFDVLTQEKTLVVIAHRLNTIQNADQILVVENGQIVQRDKHEELLAQPGLYRRFWDEREKAKGWQIGAVAIERLSVEAVDQ
ncbi:ATP-binding cassette domain-containing protein [bacterium]|nr:ATP-binding cassette domain-containing protein [bacterium]